MKEDKERAKESFRHRVSALRSAVLSAGTLVFLLWALSLPSCQGGANAVRERVLDYFSYLRGEKSFVITDFISPAKRKALEQALHSLGSSLTEIEKTLKPSIASSKVPQIRAEEITVKVRGHFAEVTISKELDPGIKKEISVWVLDGKWYPYSGSEEEKKKYGTYP